jgi:glycosyltransferase involved in cell wall biosynthesis
MTADPTITFIIPVRNDEARLARCLASIAGNAQAACEILVIDNGSIDGSVAVARRAGATAIELPYATVAEMRNTGAKAAQGACLAFVDADHILDAGWVTAALETLEDENVTAAGAPYDHPERCQLASEGLRPAEARAQGLRAGRLAGQRQPDRARRSFSSRRRLRYVSRDMRRCGLVQQTAPPRVTV